MHLSRDSVKHRSLGLWSTILATAMSIAVSGATTGCVIVDDDDDDDYHGNTDRADDPPALPEPVLVSIDTDQTVNSEPGEGAGLFVEYQAGGTWRFWTTCDTNYSNVACKFDAFVSVDTSSVIEAVEENDLEGFDDVEVLENGEAHLHAETSSDIDMMTVTTTPGAIVRVEVYLDDVLNERFIYWVGGGVLHTGAPTNPVDFEPTSP